MIDTEKEFAKAKKAQAKYENAKLWFIQQLPQDVQLELHYNGLRGVYNQYPEYYKYLKALE